MKILITGATGGLGSSVAEFLLKKINPENLVLLSRAASQEKVSGYKSQGVEVRLGDYDDKASLVSAFQNIDVLYFVSGSDVMARTKQHENIVEAAKSANINHIVYTSAAFKNDSESSPVYPVVNSHLLTEGFIKDSGLAYTILRHNLYAEVIPMFIGGKEQLMQSKSIYLPAKEGKVAFASRIDLAEAASVVLTNLEKYVNQTMELNGSTPFTFEQVASELSSVVGEQIAYISPELNEFKSTMASYGVPEEGIGAMAMFSEGIAQGEFDKSDQSLAKILGHDPQSLSDYLKGVYGA